ncbi:hypothetical protein SLEP1_g17384 [Rubroshorea leprosula]|uniref:Leucine-rich repeat-containing N-terminal plant-type domain-containing protein n=1 Tax=Rubroshorea leprosula TaxID=152421 RepID=A0AAV5J4J1_9ROSI|nr:hypothetical protein SLEP1_g17384 [Rubroshorea leprosula]
MNLALYMFAALLIAFPRAAAVALTGISEYYPSERATLLQLRDSLNSAANLHSNWTGSPCINNQSKWDGIDCWNGYVVGIVLDEIQLKGSLPPDFPQNITFLTKLSLRKNFLLLELQQNQLSGEIPPIDQQTLIGFNVSYNHLHSQIPETNILKGFPDSSSLRNPGLCGRPSKGKCPSPPPPPTVPPPTPQPHPSPVSPVSPGPAPQASKARVSEQSAPERSIKKESSLGLATVKKKLPSWITEDPERTVELEFLQVVLLQFLNIAYEFSDSALSIYDI